MIVCSTLKIDLTSVEGINDWVLLTDAPFDIVGQDGLTYRHAGALLKIDKITSENTLSNRVLKCTLSGVDRSIVSVVNNHKFRNKDIEIRKCFVEDDGNRVTDSSIYFSGITQTPEYTVDDNGTATLGIGCKSIFDLSSKPSLVRSNNASHQLWFTKDQFFKYATSAELEDEMWTRA
ncbi:hypothetical protein ACYHQE_004473 [Aeromonas salmonicida]